MRGRTGEDVTTMKEDGRGLHATSYRRRSSESNRFLAVTGDGQLGPVRCVG